MVFGHNAAAAKLERTRAESGRGGRGGCGSRGTGSNGDLSARQGAVGPRIAALLHVLELEFVGQLGAEHGTQRKHGLRRIKLRVAVGIPHARRVHGRGSALRERRVVPEGIVAPREAVNRIDLPVEAGEYGAVGGAAPENAVLRLVGVGAVLGADNVHEPV